MDDMLIASSAVTAPAPIDGIGSQGKTQAEYRVHVSQASDAAADPEWDAFLAQTPGGHHAQTSLWAQLKATVGWQSVRIVITQSVQSEYDKQIVAGVQVLLRALPIAGTIGFVPKGPVFAGPDPALRQLLLTQLDELAKTYRMMQLILQPAREDETLETMIAQRGFRPSPLEVFPTASVVIDLQQDLDVILASMKSETRYNIRRGQRKGMRVREGKQHDIPAFYRMFQATSQRQDFSVKSEAYYAEKHRLLSPHGYCKLFLAEYKTEVETEVVSAMLAIPFGDTVLFKRGGWSGRRGNLRPNEVMHWAAIQWAKAQGYRYRNPF